MLGRRIVAIAAVVIALICGISWFEKEEQGHLMGLAVRSEEALRQEWGDNTFYDALENAGELLLFDGNIMPYDSLTNTFYITQNTDNASYDGTLGVSDDRIDACFIADGYETQKALGIAEGHTYRIWLCDGNAAAICNVVMSGLPVVAVNAEDLPDDSLLSEEAAKDIVRAKPEYIDGDISVLTADDEDLGNISDRTSHMECKRSTSGETITCKLCSKKDSDNKKISFLSMGKHDAWKLYKVSEQDDTCIQMMLAYEMWNECTAIEKLSVPCRFVELVVNDKYEGLYILRPRTDDDYFDLSDKNMVIQTEDMPADQKIYTKYRPMNAEDFGLWLQATESYVVLFDDMVIIDDGNESLFLPGKPEYVFGNFPGRYSYMSYQSEQRIIKASDFEWDEDAKALEKTMSSEWKEARNSFLNDDTLAAEIWDMISYLKQSGLATRRNISDESVTSLIDGLGLRYGYVDRYYEDY